MANEKVITLTAANFNTLVLEADKPVLVDFWAPWCGPCRRLGPVIDEIALESDDILVGKVNVDDEPELAEEFGVFSIPTLVILKNGELAHQSAGARPKEQILKLLDESVG